jgi:arylsulfatase A-like enzyme
VQTPVRDVDVAPTVLSAVGMPQPESMEGIPLLEVDPDALAADPPNVYTETDLWTSPDQSPLTGDLRLSYGPPSAWLEEDPESPGRLRIQPAAEDAVLAYRHRLLQTGTERLVYRPTRAAVAFECYNLVQDPAAAADLSRTRAGAERVKELKEVLFQELRREAGWRPQNDFWIPEAMMREKK